jgi:hypothetical protein
MSHPSGEASGWKTDAPNGFTCERRRIQNGVLAGALVPYHDAAVSILFGAAEVNRHAFRGSTGEIAVVAALARQPRVAASGGTAGREIVLGDVAALDPVNQLGGGYFRTTVNSVIK